MKTLPVETPGGIFLRGCPKSRRRSRDESNLSRIEARATSIRDFWEAQPAAKTVLEQWHKVVRGAKWLHFTELRHTFNHADVATTDKGNPVVIFDVGGNKYRVIAALHYDRGICYILRVLTHKQYDTDRWKKEL
jgi:mRNA interferase HigB